MVYLTDTFFTSAYSRIASYRQIILDYLAMREQLEDKGQGNGQEKGSVQDKDKDKGKDKDKSSLKCSLKGSEKDKNTTPKNTVVVVPLPFPHTLASMVLTVWAASTCLRRISALTSTEVVDQDQDKSNNKGQGQGQDRNKQTTATTTATTTVASTASTLAAPLISDRPLPPLLLLLADLTRATFRYKAPYPC